MLHIKVERVIVINPWFKRFVIKSLNLLATLFCGLRLPDASRFCRQAAVMYAISTAAPSGFQFNGLDQGQKLVYVFGSIAPAGNYAAGGDTWDFTKMSIDTPINSSYAPIPGSVSAQSNSAANGHSGYQYYYRPGVVPTMQNGRFQVLQSNGTLLVDIGAGAYPAAVIADTIVFAAAFVRL